MFWDTWSDSRACRWMRMNRRGSLRAHGGRLTWLTRSPFWRTPKSKPAEDYYTMFNSAKARFTQLPDWKSAGEQMLAHYSPDGSSRMTCCTVVGSLLIYFCLHPQEQDRHWGNSDWDFQLYPLSTCNRTTKKQKISAHKFQYYTRHTSNTGSV